MAMIAFVERRPTPDLSRVLWDSGPCIEVATPICPPPPQQGPGAKRMAPSPNHMRYILWFHKVRVFELWTLKL